MSIDTLLIAVVDDDVAVCRSVQRLLRSAGLSATTFTSGVEFLASLEATTPDCVVLDIRMPVMSGFGVQSRMLEMGRVLPVVFISAEARAELAGETLAAGGFAFLQKPFDGQELIDTIDSAIRSEREMRRR